MGVRKRKDTGKWQAYYRDLGGRQRSKDFERKRDAQRWEAAQKRSIESREWIDPKDSKVPLNSLWQAFLSTRSLKPSTESSYNEVWKTLVEPRWGEVPIDGITTNDVLVWVNNMEGPRGKVSAARARKAHQILKSVLDVAVRDRRILSNPANLPKGSVPKVMRKRAHAYLSPSEAMRLARACGRHDTLVLVLSFLGLRWGEAIALQVQDIDFERRRIRVCRSYSTSNGRPVLTTPKTHQEREIPVPDFLNRLLTQACTNKEPGDLIFANGQAALRQQQLPNSCVQGRTQDRGSPTHSDPRVASHCREHRRGLRSQRQRRPAHARALLGADDSGRLCRTL